MIRLAERGGASADIVRAGKTPDAAVISDRARRAASGISVKRPSTRDIPGSAVDRGVSRRPVLCGTLAGKTIVTMQGQSILRGLLASQVTSRCAFHTR
jgi:hypothetical protein